MDAPPARIPSLLALAALLFAIPGCREPEPELRMVEVGRSVALEYTLTLEDGTPVGESTGDESMRFRVGADQIAPGLERELIGLRVGDRRRVVVDPKDGYGSVREEGFQEIDIARIPEEFRVVGAQIDAQDGTGNSYPVRVHEVRDQTIVLDANHPFAGKTLIFEVRIVEID